MANSETAAMPACPRCRSNSDIHPLVRDEDRQRFNCQRCSENFWSTPLPQAGHDPTLCGPIEFVPISIPQDTGEPAGKCPKCLKPYLRLGKRFDAHVASCDGSKKYVPSAPRRQREPKNIQSPTQVYAASIAALLARRAALEAEIRGIDLAVADINEKMKGAGGPAPVPFAVGSPPTL